MDNTDLGFEEYYNGPLTDMIGFNEDRRRFLSKLSSKRISFGLIRLAFPGLLVLDKKEC